MVRNFSPPLDISIHALREEGDLLPCPLCWTGAIFLSTPSARRATWASCICPFACLISIHALREEGDVQDSVEVQAIHISIHALREEGD